MRLKRLFSCFLSGVILLGIAGCGAESTVNADDLVIPVYEDAGEMVLRVDLPPNMASREQMLLYKECGFNAIPLTEDFFSAGEVAPYMDELRDYKAALELWNGDEATKPVEPEKPRYIQALELCEELGIDVFIRPHEKEALINDPPAKDNPNYEEYINTPNYFEKYFYNMDFHDYPAVKGFFIADEPTYGYVVDLANRYLPWFNENYGGGDYEVLINHLSPRSTGWKDKQSQNMMYDEFINYYNDNFLSKLDSANKLMGFDTYVLHNDGVNNYVSDSFLSSCMSMRKYADAFGVGFAAYIQCFTGYSTLRDPSSYGDFTFQVCTYLAFGAERLSFYGYRAYPPENHLVTAGEPNQKWYWVKQVNSMIKKLDGLLLNFDWEGVYTNVGSGSFFEVNEAFEAIKNDSLNKLKGVDSFSSKYDSIVGQFKDKNGNNAFMLVNYEEPSITHTNKVTMKFTDADGVLYYRDGEPIVEGLKNKQFSIDLQAGEGVFIIPLYKK